MKKKSLFLALFLIFTLLLTACGAANSGMSADKAGMQIAPAASANPSESIIYDKNYGISSDGSYLETPTQGEIYNNDSNKIIRTADITIQTTEFDAAVESLNHLTQNMGGYYETAKVESGGYYNQYANRSAYFVVRIPRENFTAFRDSTGSIGHVRSLSESSQDVGESYYDTEARLNTLTTKRDRLLSLLEKAGKMEDIITLENALADVQYQIDMYTSTLRKYDSLIGYSTFRISLNEVIEISNEPSEKESFGSKFISNLKKGFKEFGEAVQDFAIWFARNLIGVMIFVAVVIVIVVVVRRALRRRRARKNTASE